MLSSFQRTKNRVGAYSHLPDVSTAAITNPTNAPRLIKSREPINLGIAITCLSLFERNPTFQFVRCKSDERKHFLNLIGLWVFN